MKIHLAILSATILASRVSASWIALPLETVITQSHVVVIAEVTAIKTSAPSDSSDRYQYDVGSLTVQKVLWNSLTNHSIKAMESIPLSMPSANNRLRVSTDIRYKVGKKGVWMLQLRDNTFWATYPMDFQPLSEEQRISAIIEKTVQQPLSPGVDKRKSVR